MRGIALERCNTFASLALCRIERKNSSAASASRQVLSARGPSLHIAAPQGVGREPGIADIDFGSSRDEIYGIVG